MSVVRILMILAVIAATGFTQQKNGGIDELRRNYESFKYREVIASAESLLQNKSGYVSADVIEIYRLKALSHYSLAEESKAEQSFIEIIRIDRAYELDPVRTSPKIISFFRDVKNRAVPFINTRVPEQVKDTVYIKEPVYVEVVKHDTVVVRNTDYPQLLLPGLVQYTSGERGKGITLMTITGLSFLSSVYFYFDTRAKERDYLNAVVRSEIQSKYSAFNTSYTLRNFSLGALAAVFLYSQADLLFLRGAGREQKFSVYFTPLPGGQTVGVKLIF